jgi:hypothetical protein
MGLLILYYSSTPRRQFQHAFLTYAWRDRDCVKVVMRPTDGVGKKIPRKPFANTGGAIAAMHAGRNIPVGVETLGASKFREIVAPAF